MSWFWGGGSGREGGEKSQKPDDPYKNLDPSLRDFLNKESASQRADQQKENGTTVPRRDSPHAASASTGLTPATNYRAQLGLGEQSQPDDPNAPPREKAKVPPQSLFPDGRYADLWKTYTPQTELDTAFRSDQDKLADIADAYKERKAAIGRAALENCVLEQLAERECLRSGNLTQTMTLCRTEKRAFLRCYEMQARFLKALGYLSHAYRSGEDANERIQMHADQLYHEMLERERVQEEARKAGKEVPAFKPLIQHDSIEAALGADSAWSQARRRAQEKNLPVNFSQFPPEKQNQIRANMTRMSESEKELELQLIAAEQRAQYEYTESWERWQEEEKRNRAERRERGKETVGDRIKRYWGWDQ